MLEHSNSKRQRNTHTPAILNESAVSREKQNQIL
jgi:hypothetical protein